jgi:hypothetical protein
MRVSVVAMGTRYLPIGEEGSFCFVELFPEDGLSGGSGVWVSPPERSLWLPPTEVSLLPCAFPLGLLGGFLLVLPASLFPEDGLSGGSGVWVSPPERSLWLPPTDCAEADPVFIANMAAAKNNADTISFRFIILSSLFIRNR